MKKHSLSRILVVWGRDLRLDLYLASVVQMSGVTACDILVAIRSIMMVFGAQTNDTLVYFFTQTGEVVP